jgi:hypothetical protein
MICGKLSMNALDSILSSGKNTIQAYEKDRLLNDPKRDSEY